MTDEEAGLMAAICKDPADDTARLVYADYIEEQGEVKRAAFIRTQIANAVKYGDSDWIRVGHPPNPYRPTFEEVMAVNPWDYPAAHDIDPIICIAAGTWKKPNYSLCVAWHRGFPAVVGCTARAWHLNYDKFTVPLEAAGVRDGNGVWGVYYPNSEVVVYTSMVRRGIEVKFKCDIEMSVGFRLSTVNKKAFPNVAHFFETCNRELIVSVCQGDLRKTAMSV